MNKSTSIYLDLIRFVAAFIVFASHAAGARLTGGLFWQIGPYGAEAVDVFFVLSGFVIAYVCDTREHDLTEYAISRCARIYSVVAPALILTFVLDALGRAAKPSLYTADWGYAWTGRVSQFLHAITFTNQIWFNRIAPGSDLPFWSLGFEVWYYIAFGVVMFTSKRRRVVLMILALLIMGPKIDALLPIWLMGVAAYHALAKWVIPLTLGWLMCVGAIIAWGGYEFLAWHLGRPVAANWLGRAHIIQDYIIGTLFTLHLIGFRRISHVPAGILTKSAAPIRWIAGSTLTLYLMHLPLLQFVAAESPWPVTAWQTRSMELLGVPLTILVVAQFTERRKKIWRDVFRNIFQNFAEISAG
ncbi:putative acyltransferase [Acidiphilium multivorum AIU301]|uniref:Putative acyltransferase n=2 Tax=Acidocellaceae TaxID=3385905 RepID=F0IZJ8_ACIMA|nr:putative acyltransferase [Acidiphilium multivorum AIU301]